MYTTNVHAQPSGAAPESAPSIWQRAAVPWLGRALRFVPGPAAATLIAFLVVAPGIASAAPLWTSMPSGGWDCGVPSIERSNRCLSHTGFKPTTSHWGQYTNANGNCTNYAAYRLARNGAPNFLKDGQGNAIYWKHHAQASRKAVNGTPAVGAIAWWDGSGANSKGQLGHVAYVEMVRGQTVYLSESVWDGDGIRGGSRRFRVTPGDSRQWPDAFLHIKDQPKSKPKPRAPQPSDYRGHIVQWSGDTKQQKTAWLVGPDLKRRHIPSAAVYHCLKAKGHPGPTVLPPSMLNRLTDLRGVKAECTPPPPRPTPAPQPAPAPQPTPAPTPQPPRKVITVYNKVTNGPTQMREDPIPVRLTTKPWKLCGSRGCNINGTERTSGQRYDAATCWTTGDLTTNGNNSNSVDANNPNRYSSDRYYRVRLGNGTTGFVSWAWIHPSHRGGLGLPRC